MDIIKNKKLKSTQTARIIKFYIILPAVLSAFAIMILIWPDKYSNIRYDNNVFNYDDINFTADVSIDNNDLSRVFLTINILSKSGVYHTGEILKQTIIPSGYRIGDDGYYFEFLNDKSRGVSSTGAIFEIATRYPFSPFSSKSSVYLDPDKTNNLPSIIYEFMFKLCTKNNVCKNYKIKGRLDYTRIEGYHFYSPLELFNSLVFIYIFYPILRIYIIILIILFARYIYVLRTEENSS